MCSVLSQGWKDQDGFMRQAWPPCSRLDEKTCPTRWDHCVLVFHNTHCGNIKTKKCNTFVHQTVFQSKLHIIQHHKDFCTRQEAEFSGLLIWEAAQYLDAPNNSWNRYLVWFHLDEVSNSLWLREQGFVTSFSCLYRPFVVTWNFIRLANSCDNHCNGGSGCVSCWVYNIVSELISIPYLFCQECKYEIVLVKNWFVMWGKVHQKTRKI